MKNDEVKVVVQCEGNCSETMEISKIEWGNECDYYIQFRTDTFYDGQSVVRIIKRRINLAWLAIRKGNYIHQEIITSKESLIQLRDGLNKILSEEKI